MSVVLPKETSSIGSNILIPTISPLPANGPEGLPATTLEPEGLPAAALYPEGLPAAALIPSRRPRRSNVSRQLDELFEVAERNLSCLVTCDLRTKRSLDRRVVTGTVIAPRKALYSRTSYWEQLERQDQELHILRALHAKHPAWVFSHASAALLHGLYVSWARLDPTHIMQTRDQRGSRSGVVIRHTIKQADVTLARGLPATSVVQTAIDCLCTLPFGEALAIADSTLRLHRLGREDLLNLVLTQARRRRGCKNALRAALWANPLSENGGESLARSVMILNGFELPRLQVEIPNPLDPRNPYRVDFYWELDDGTIVIGELDGMEKRRNKRMTKGKDIERLMAEERLRESRIIALTGCLFMRFSFKDAVQGDPLIRMMDAHGIPRTGALIA